jgi:hypothetical protein
MHWNYVIQQTHCTFHSDVSFSIFEFSTLKLELELKIDKYKLKIITTLKKDKKRSNEMNLLNVV